MFDSVGRSAGPTAPGPEPRCQRSAPPVSPSRCSPPCRPLASGAAPPPIVLVSIDTLRSDRLPSYGYRGVETPAIDALARDGVLFEHAYSHAPLTLPAHLSMLTGLLPGEHGVRDNSGYRFEAARNPYAPELLRRAGYATAGMASSYVLRAETGFSAGFERFDADVDPGTSNAVGEAQRSGRVTLELAKRWLDEARSPALLPVPALLRAAHARTSPKRGSRRSTPIATTARSRPPTRCSASWSPTCGGWTSTIAP